MQSMMKRYVLSKLAETDLSGIWRYTVENWSRQQADIYVNNLLHACEVIATAPTVVGTPYDQIREGYWKYRCAHHVLFYKVLEDGIPFITRVLHERMDFDRHLLPV